jgi:hypothetical protein
VTSGPDEGFDMVNPADTQLLDELRRAASQSDPPPPTVVEAARSSFTWRTIDAELAALTFDSGVDRPVTALRGSAGPRLMTFSSSGLDIEVEVVNLGSQRQLVGQLVPPQAADIDVRHAAGTTTIQADQLGRFVADAIGSGPVSLRCRLAATPSGPPVVTEWVPL